MVSMYARERWRLGHRRGLDGIRAIAVLLVVATHFDRGQVTLGGVMGVTVFFTLSGFLITTLLLEEHNQTGRISRRRFYTHRALRLFPALAVMLFTVCVLTLAGFPTDVRPGMVASVLGYVSNWYLAATTVHGHVVWGALGHTWSLAIEEQFYIVWPLVVLFALRWGRRGVLVAASAGAMVSVTWALVSARSTLCSDVSAYGLLVGCALAAWMHGRSAHRPPRWLAPLALVPVVAAAGTDARTLMYVAVPLLAAVAIFTVAQSSGGWLTVRPLVWVGKRSYGLYLWHVPVAYLCEQAAGPWVVISGIGIAVSVGLTALSWRYVETPFLRLKDAMPATESSRGPTSPKQPNLAAG